MPNMANIVIKKSDGTTDVTYTAQQGASGDKVSARWANLTVGTTNAERPTLLVRSESNGTNTARRISGVYFWPTTSQDAGGNKVVKGGMNGAFSVLIPQNQPSADIKEQAYQFGNLLASLLIKQTFDEGFAPR